MKKIIILSLILLTFVNCSDEKYEASNVDETSPTNVPAYFLVTNATTSLFDQMTTTNVNLNVFKLYAQYYTQCQYTDESNYELEERDIPGNHWSELYRDVLFDLKNAKEKVSNDTSLLPEVRDNQIAIIDAMEVYTWQVLVDTFGDIPYTEALQGLNNPTPAYDDDVAIYESLINRISDDIQKFDASVEGFGSKDLIYAGDVSKWKKFAASVKLKLGVQIIDVNPALATTTINEAVSAGVISSNSENFTLNYLSTDPYQNPIAVEINTRNDFVSANTIVDKMNSLSDPRRSFYFDDNMGTNTFIGGTYGAGSVFSDFSHLSDDIYDFQNPATLLDYSEVEFMLAEAIAKGIAVSGTIESHYNNGISASMEYWGISTTDITSYLTNPNVAYSTASGTSLQKIATQAWIAMYNRGFEAWTLWRRLDYPVLASPAPVSGLPIPLRYTYPMNERTINITNYQAASAAIGGDEQQTKVFWDIH